MFNPKSKSTRLAVIAGVSGAAVLGVAGIAFSQGGAAGGAAPAPAAGAGRAAAPGAPGAAPGGGGGGRGAKPNFNFDDNAGWVAMFNGRTLAGWTGDTRIWQVKDESIYAENTCEKPIPGTVYIHWNGEAGDFDLKLRTKIIGQGNGGVQYRGWLRDEPGHFAQPIAPATVGAAGAAPAGGGRAGAPAAGAPGAAPAAGAAAAGGRAGAPAGAPAAAGAAAGAGRAGAAAPAGGAAAAGGGRAGGAAQSATCPSGAPRGTPIPNEDETKYYIAGPQYDYNINGTYAGQWYEQSTGRSIVASPGQIVEASPGPTYAVLATIADTATVQSWWKLNDWNDILIVARGHTYMHYINGHLSTIMIDNDPNYYKDRGMIGFEIEGQQQLWMKDLYIRKFN